MIRLRIIQILAPISMAAAIIFSFWFAIYPILYVVFIASLNVQNKWGRFVRRCMWWAITKQYLIKQVGASPLAYPILILIELGGREHYIEKGHDRFIDYLGETLMNPPKHEPEKDIYVDTYFAQHRPDLVMERYSDLDKALSDPNNYDDKGNYINLLN